MRSTLVQRISRLLLCSFLLSKIIGKDAQGALTPSNLTLTSKVSDPVENGDTEQGLADFNCKIYSDCNVDTKACYCDHMCNMFNECCMNAPSGNNTSISNLGLLQDMTCKKWNEHHIWVVTECPSEAEVTCTTEGYDFSNALVTDENNITYSTYRCALCHGVSKYTYWTFMITHGRGSDSPCNSSTNIACDDLDHSLESCINTLLEKGCNVNVYPPDGTSVRFCIETEKLTTNLSCNGEYLPITNKYFRKPYRNADCCAKLEGECSLERYTCWRMKLLEEYFRPSKTPICRSTHTVFSFDKECKDGSMCGEVMFVGFVFELDVRFKYKTETPDVLDTYSVVCLLKRYLQEMADALSLVEGKSQNVENIAYILLHPSCP